MWRHIDVQAVWRILTYSRARTPYAEAFFSVPVQRRHVTTLFTVLPLLRDPTITLSLRFERTSYLAVSLDRGHCAIVQASKLQFSRLICEGYGGPILIFPGSPKWEGHTMMRTITNSSKSCSFCLTVEPRVEVVLFLTFLVENNLCPHKTIHFFKCQRRLFWPIWLKYSHIWYTCTIHCFHLVETTS